MNEGVEILISADDQASVKVAQAADNVAKAEAKVDAIVKSLQSPLDRYEAQLKELEAQHKSGVLSTEKYAVAQQALAEKIQGSGNAYKEVGGKAKSATEFVGTLANISGGGALASMATQLAEVSDRVGNFSEVAKGGKASAFAFRAGLVGLVGTIAVQAGKAIGDLVFETAKLDRAFENTKVKAGELSSAIQLMQSQVLADNREDIELIRDPEAKQAAYQQMLETLGKNIEGVSGKVRAGEKAVEDYAAMWFQFDNDKAMSEMASAQLADDRERLKVLKAQQNELNRLTSARTADNAEIAKKNALAERSSDYLASLRDEVEILKATKEEQLALEAARNTSVADRGEAERLLRERDAIHEKVEAEKELAAARKTASDEWLQQSAQMFQAMDNEAARMGDIIKREEQRLKLRQIEIEQGKEAAKAQALMDQGVGGAKAREFAAREAALDQQAKLAADKGATGGKPSDTKGNQASTLQAAESRLLSRGSADQQGEKLVSQSAQANSLLAKMTAQLAKLNEKKPVEGVQVKVIR